MEEVKAVNELLQYKDYIFAALFVFLLIWVLKTNGEREKNYQAIIKNLTENLGIKLDKLEMKVESWFNKKD